MTWFKVDDTLAFHRKAVTAGNAAMGMWVRAGSWCAQQLTDGFIPADVALTIGTPAQASRLVRVGLWHEVENGFRFHEWTQEGRQPSRDEVMDRRRADQARKREARKKGEIFSGDLEKSADGYRSVKKGPFSETSQVGDTCPPGFQAASGRNPSGVRASRPVYKTRTHLEEESSVSEGGSGGEALAPNPPATEAATSAPRKRAAATAPKPPDRGTRLPEDFAVTSAMVAWARANTPGVDGRWETEKFVDYWAAKTGKDATKKDWVRAWRNWMRGAHDRLPNNPRKARLGNDAKIAGWEAMKEHPSFTAKELTPSEQNHVSGPQRDHPSAATRRLL